MTDLARWFRRERDGLRVHQASESSGWASDAAEVHLPHWTLKSLHKLDMTLTVQRSIVHSLKLLLKNNSTLFII